MRQIYCEKGVPTHWSGKRVHSDGSDVTRAQIDLKNLLTNADLYITVIFNSDAFWTFQSFLFSFIWYTVMKIMNASSSWKKKGGGGTNEKRNPNAG